MSIRSMPDAFRERVMRCDTKSVMLTRFDTSRQAVDLSVPPNAGGVGRVRHFTRRAAPNWIENPLPIDPACHSLGLSRTDALTAQVYQLAVCDWRCWYCYVPFENLTGDPNRSEWKSTAELVDAWERLPARSPIIDLSGGQPELVPEWIVWMMDELTSRQLEQSVYLWSDDNLSVDFTFRFLSANQLERLRSYKNYGRVGCFKGFDRVSFRFNTGAAESEYEGQFERFARLKELGIDLYAYVTLTHPHSRTDVPRLMASFVDRLQRIDHVLPLRTVPLLISEFSPLIRRLNVERRTAMDSGQYLALSAWQEQLAQRYTAAEIAAPIWEAKWQGR